MGAKPAVAFSPPIALAKADIASPRLTLATILAVDFLALSVVYWLAVVGRYLVNPGYTLTFYLQCFPVIALFLLAFSMDGLYPGLLLHPAEEFRRVTQCVSVVFLIFASFIFIWRNGEIYSRSIFLITWAAGAPVILLARYIARHACSRRPWWGYSAVVLGSGPVAQRIVRNLQKTSGGVRVIGVLTDENASAWPGDLPPVVGGLHDATQIAARSLATHAILAVPNRTNDELRRTIQNYCKGFRHILLLPDLPGICSMGIGAREIGAEVGFELPQRLFHPGARLTKRILDVCLTSVLLLILSPVFLIAALLIKATSKGPVFFGHTRHGQHGEAFQALKFRTMVPHADHVLAEYLLAHPEHQLEWRHRHKLKDDPRITSVGKWIRRYSLDELPQLWNVLRGEMSLVGPRPIVKLEIERYGSGYDLYTRVLPGLTGLWQVSGRNNTTYEERVAFDEYYVRNWSIWLDVYILVRTVKVVLTAEGAY